MCSVPPQSNDMCNSMTVEDSKNLCGSQHLCVCACETQRDCFTSKVKNCWGGLAGPEGHDVVLSLG